jgi:aminoglycoside phosphotransferase (APT) family kinase protein
VIFHPSEPRILAVIDWELSTLGHPLSDFAYHCMAWRLSPGQFRGLAGPRPRRPRHPGRNRLRRRSTAAAPGARRSRRREWEYYLAFNMFRLTAILQGIMARVQYRAMPPAQEAIDTGKRARPLAEEAWRQVERLLVINY